MFIGCLIADAGLRLTALPRHDTAREEVAEEEAEADDATPWLQDGGLFAEEDDSYRRSQPSNEIPRPLGACA